MPDGAERQASPTGLRIAVVGQGTYPIPPRGYAPVERHIAGLVEALRCRGENVYLINRVFPRFKFRLLVHALWASAQIRRLKPDIIHCHSPINAWVLSRLGHHPVVFTTHSRQWTFLGESTSRELRNHIRAYRAVQARILLAPNVRDAIARDKGLAGLPWAVVVNGVDTDRFRPSPAPRLPKRLIGVGIVAAVKRWHIAAAAARTLGWEIEIIGPIAEPAYAASVVEANPGVVLRGEVSDGEVLDALQRATVLVHPSKAEAMPLAVLEAMSTGLPVLGTQLLRDIVQDGVEGWLVEEDSDARMADALALRLRSSAPDEILSMGRRAAERVRRNHAWATVAAATCRVYENVVNGPDAA